MTQIVGLLLAAGQGRRFGGDKLLHPLADGTPMAVASARRLRSACPHSIAVLRPEQQVLAGLLTAVTTLLAGALYGRFGAHAFWVMTGFAGLAIVIMLVSRLVVQPQRAAAGGLTRLPR